MPPKEIIAPGPDIESWLIEEELDEKLMELINQLPAPLRETVRLRMAGLEEKEVAMCLGVRQMCCSTFALHPPPRKNR